MGDRKSFDKMDVDRETPAAASSPPNQSSPKFPGAANPPLNGDNAANSEGPPPPPHRSNPSSPVPTAEDEAEAYKAAGNKFFKEKDYRNAIIQYTKGMCARSACPPICQGWNLLTVHALP